MSVWRRPIHHAVSPAAYTLGCLSASRHSRGSRLDPHRGLRPPRRPRPAHPRAADLRALPARVLCLQGLLMPGLSTQPRARHRPAGRAAAHSPRPCRRHPRVARPRRQPARGLHRPQPRQPHPQLPEHVHGMRRAGARPDGEAGVLRGVQHPPGPGRSPPGPPAEGPLAKTPGPGQIILARARKGLPKLRKPPGSIATRSPRDPTPPRSPCTPPVSDYKAFWS